MRPAQLYIAPDRTRWIFKTYRVDRAEGYWTQLFDNRSSGLGDIWQTISGALNAGAQVYGTLQQIRAQQQANRGPSTQAQMDMVWAQVQQAFGQLLSAAQSSPQAAAQALQQGARVQAEYEAIKPQFSSLCCTQAQGVSNRIAEWMARLQQMASVQPSGAVTGGVITGSDGAAQTGGNIFNSSNLLLPALIIAAALFLKG